MKHVTLRGGPPAHPHVYSKRILDVDRGVDDGDVVLVRTREGKPCGHAFYHSRSLVALRLLSFDPDAPPDTGWLRERIRAADELRREVLRLPEVTDAWRVVHGEGDALSGLVVDRYGATGVVSLQSFGWYRRLSEVERVLREEVGVERVIVRVDRKTSTQEGFDVPPPRGIATVEIQESGIRFLADLAQGHKTGFFLDQRDNRAFFARLARGRDVFDGMTYTGGFAIAAARAGAASDRAMDLDEKALALAERNAALNEVDVAFEHGDVFEALRDYARRPESERPDAIVLDPPKWARDRAGLGAALARHADLNRLAFEAVRPGGILLTHSCSGLLSEERFLALLRGVALDTRREARLLRVGGAAPDHPVSTSFPEGRYLKNVLLVVGPPGSGPGVLARDRGRT